MRYVQIATVPFTRPDGQTVAIKDIRPIPRYQIRQTLTVIEGDRIDEIASRPGVYGEEGYTKSFRIFDANAVRMIENRGQIEKVRKLKIPV